MTYVEEVIGSTPTAHPLTFGEPGFLGSAFSGEAFVKRLGVYKVAPSPVISRDPQLSL